MNRKFQYFEVLGDTSDCITVTVSESWIIAMFYPSWKAKMRAVNKNHLINEERCIQDFTTINWAVEL